MKNPIDENPMADLISRQAERVDVSDTNVGNIMIADGMGAEGR